MSWYHLTQRKTKDNKPKVYGKICTQKKQLKELTRCKIDNVSIYIYEGKHENDILFDNFITACLPFPLCTLYTNAKDVYIKAQPSVPSTFWDNLPNWIIHDCKLFSTCSTTLTHALST